MLTPKDVQSMTEHLILAFRDIFATKADIARLEERFDQLQTSVDGIARDNLNLDKDKIISNYRLDKLEEWTGKAAPKLGIDFTH
jgi:hypothetical protein